MHASWTALWISLASPSAYAATTVAVLPLEQGAGSEAHAGLGTALSGMLVADLSVAPGLVLVERTRLDAVLSEIALSETGFLDPGYRRFIQRRLREIYGFEGSPIVLNMRVRERRQR